MKNFQLTFSLKQHTPLIHFQHNQARATLRATEVKPKLDKFIRERFLHLKSIRQHKELNAFQETVERFFPEPSKTPFSSPYKIVFLGEPIKYFLLHSQNFKSGEKSKANGAFSYEAPIDFLEKTSYFADNEKIKNGKWNETKLGINYKNLDGEVFSFHPPVIRLIKAALPYFFCLHNFGCRQSKGFGSFTIKQINGHAIALNHQQFLAYLNESPEWVYLQKVAYVSSEDTLDQKVASKINDIYKNIKCLPPDTSAVRDYFEDLNISWEKPFITDNLVKSQPDNPPLDYKDDDDKKFVRALLGLAELHDYQQLGVKIKIRDCEGRHHIERFQSPILFKVFEGNIFLCARPVPNILLNRTFEFSRLDNPESSMLLKTPYEFNIENFLETHFNN